MAKRQTGWSVYDTSILQAVDNQEIALAVSRVTVRTPTKTTEEFIQVAFVNRASSEIYTLYLTKEAALDLSSNIRAAFVETPNA